MVSVSVVIPVRNGAPDLLRCLLSIAHSRVTPFECIVVDDASSDTSAQIAGDFGATVLRLRKQSGPAVARNLGVQSARGDVVLFIDADVSLLPDAIERLIEHFAADPDLTAVFGSYADRCPNPDFFSLYKNLQHAFVHRSASGAASTFWSGCGAIRRKRFLAYGGFDETYGRPCIEDIELGTRLARIGEKIRVDGAIQVEHRKQYKFLSMVRSDLFDRAIPWTQLILREGKMPNTLNVANGQRTAAALVWVFLALVSGSALFHGVEALTPWAAMILLAVAACLIIRRGRSANISWATVALLLGLAAASRLQLEDFDKITLAAAAALSGVLFINRKFYRFLADRGGWALAIAAVPFHLLYYVYGVIGFVFGAVLYVVHPPAPVPIVTSKLRTSDSATEVGALR
ncbi:MAG: glycosyltransferase family 2 protein [Bryobacterales bacterium]|nr:glycosyltransferase family 2 protein [Bryobacterales bacterium]